MKKIFLTSGIISLMAISAFATENIKANGKVGNNNDDPTCVIGILGTADDGATTTFDAIWVPNTYTVTYNAGTHGTGSYEDTNGATYDQNYTALTQNATGITANTGYTWVGWNTVTGQTTANWTGATPWQNTGNITVYAAYTAHTGSLTYNCGTKPGSADLSGAAPAGVSLTYDSGFTLATTPGTCAYTGWKFAGWKCDYDLSTGDAYSGSTANYPATNGTITSGNTGTYHVAADNAEITCSAMWVANTIYTSWNDNHATTPSGAPASDHCTYDGGISLPSTPPQRAGYTFAGWEAVTVTAPGQAPS